MDDRSILKYLLFSSTAVSFLLVVLFLVLLANISQTNKSIEKISSFVQDWEQLILVEELDEFGVVEARGSYAN